MTPEYAGNWYPIERIQEITGASERTLRRRLAVVADQNVRLDASRGGRPRALYHFASLPELHAAHLRLNQSQDVHEEVVAPTDYAVTPDKPAPKPPPKPPKPRGISADDLARAKLRLTAVMEFQARCETMAKYEAAGATARDWSLRERKELVKLPTKRLPGNHQKPQSVTVSLGSFEAGTLRAWAATWERTADLLDLADKKKGKSGRTPTQIPDDALTLMRAWSISTVRADVTKAKALLEAKYPEFPRVSVDTWRRRLNALDPRGFGKDLMHSLAKMRAKHSPDVEMNWESLSYNGRFEIDDVQQDWYDFTSSIEYLERPYAYAVIRVKTGQWIGFVATQFKITDAQVAELIGWIMTQKMGGIPDEWKVENLACTTTGHLVTLLTALGCRVSKTSMDGGEAAFVGAAPDGSAGHPQGHGSIERMNQGLHEEACFAAMQVGSQERFTMPLRTENFKKMALEARKKIAQEAQARGEVVIVPGPKQWAARIKQFMENMNNKPAARTPEIIDPVTGEARHMTPNEYAIHLGEQPIRRMDDRALPLFCAECVEAPVTKNGILVHKRSYGRDNTELKKYAKVKAFVSEMWPDFAYIQELGGFVSAYIKEEPGQWGQFADKRRFEAVGRSEFSEMMSKARELDGDLTLSTMCALTNPTPNRPETVVAPEEMIEEVGRMQTAVTAHRARMKTMDDRFKAPTGDAPAEVPMTSNRSSRRGLLSREEELAEQIPDPVMATDGKEESWKQ